MEYKEPIKMLIENADLMQMKKTDERLEIAKTVLPALIRNGYEYNQTEVAVRKALEIADELIRQHNKQKEEKNG